MTFTPTSREFSSISHSEGSSARPSQTLVGTGGLAWPPAGYGETSGTEDEWVGPFSTLAVGWSYIIGE